MTTASVVPSSLCRKPVSLAPGHTYSETIDVEFVRDAVDAFVSEMRGEYGGGSVVIRVPSNSAGGPFAREGGRLELWFAPATEASGSPAAITRGIRLSAGFGPDPKTGSVLRWPLRTLSEALDRLASDEPRIWAASFDEAWLLVCGVCHAMGVTLVSVGEA